MVKYGFFNSVNGDRLYNADDMSNYFSGMLTSGIFKGFENELEVVSANNGMKIKVKSGKALINFKYIYNTTDLILDVDAHSNFDRIDYVVLYYDAQQRECGIKVVKGVQSGTNTELVETETYKIIRLAYIYIDTTKTSILNTDITDLRASNWIQLTNLTATTGTRSRWSSVYDLYYSSARGMYYIEVPDVPHIDNAGVNVYFNGSRMLRDYDYTVEKSTSTITIYLNNSDLVFAKSHYQNGSRNEVAVEVMVNLTS